jgi:hypothetical protein
MSDHFAMRFQEQDYPHLWILFAAYFSAAADEYDHSAEEEVLAEYSADVGQDGVGVVLAELDRLLLHPAVWDSAMEEANRYFATATEIQQWLLFLRARLVFISESI